MSYRKICYCFVVLSFFALASRASAHLEITEIMYDPPGANAKHQWIEVYNPDSSIYTVDAKTFRFNDGASHYVNGKKDFTIPASSYIVFSGDKNTFLSDHVGFSGMVIDTSLTLHKNGDTVSLLNDGTSIDQITYTSAQGGSEDGKSLQKINNVLIAALPTPGAVNILPVEKPEPVVPVVIPPPVPITPTPVTVPVPQPVPEPIIVNPPVTTPVVTPIVTPVVMPILEPPQLPDSPQSPEPQVKKAKKVKPIAQKKVSKKVAPIVDLNTLPASASVTEAESSPANTSSIYIYIGFLAVIIAGISAILFLRRNVAKDSELIDLPKL